MVTGGNVTGIIDQLDKEGLVRARRRPTDRRASIVRLTPRRAAAFDDMAARHEQWIVELFAA